MLLSIKGLLLNEAVWVLFFARQLADNGINSPVRQSVDWLSHQRINMLTGELTDRKSSRWIVWTVLHAASILTKEVVEANGSLLPFSVRQWLWIWVDVPVAHWLWIRADSFYLFNTLNATYEISRIRLASFRPDGWVNSYFSTEIHRAQPGSQYTKLPHPDWLSRV